MDVANLGRSSFIKWRGYDKPTWEPATTLEDTEALDRWNVSRQEEESPEEGGIVRGYVRGQASVLKLRLALVTNLAFAGLIGVYLWAVIWLSGPVS